MKAFFCPSSLNPTFMAFSNELGVLKHTPLKEIPIDDDDDDAENEPRTFPT